MHLLLLTYFLALASAGCDSATPAASSPVVASTTAPALAATTAAATTAATTGTADTGTADTGTADTGAATKNTITEAQILAIAPSSKSCDGAEFKDECVTAKVAAEFISKSFDTYKVTSKAEQAAIISLIVLESGSFKYHNSHYPTPTAGKGTRNMQSVENNEKYAASLDGIKDKAASLDPAARLKLMTDDNALDFGSGAWYLTTQCSKEVRTALAKGDEAGWKGYIGCVNTPVTDERKKGWEAAVAVLGK